MTPTRLTLALGLMALTACSSSTGGGNPQVNSDYSLELRWLGTPPTGATLAAFENAANTIRQTVTGGLQSVSLPPSFTNVSQCEASLTGFPDVPRDPIPGLVIYLRIVEIDDVGGTLGSAGPCLIRSEAQNNLPALGVMRLDSADVANLNMTGRLGAVVLHEMLHILGLGTIWFDNNLLDTTTNTNARFLGAGARAACADLHGGGANCSATVPVHSADGAGSRFSHWRESLFTNELMTPFLDNVPVNPFSAMSIRSLGDLGYVVSTTAAQSFTVSGTFLRMAGSSAEPPLAMPEPLRPRFALDNAGGLVPLRRD
ncbi:MAG: hypothetical protein KF709_05510 [Gemmatimonadaceae bacterium]|nr:hypothetical protein [Gemmatimonadaceae bacterium]